MGGGGNKKEQSIVRSCNLQKIILLIENPCNAAAPRMHYWQVIFWHSPPEEIRGNQVFPFHAYIAGRLPFHVENVSNLLSTFASCQTADSRFMYCVPSNRDRPNPKPTAALVQIIVEETNVLSPRSTNKERFARQSIFCKKYKYRW